MPLQRMPPLALAAIGFAAATWAARLADDPAPSQPSTRAAIEYRDFASLTAALESLARTPGGVLTLRSIAKSPGGRDVWALDIALDGTAAPADRQTILIVGGIDAEHPASSEIALEVAATVFRQALADPECPAAQLLRQRRLLVVPRVNPDGIEAFHARPRDEVRVNAHALDEDRDGVTDEDGPIDLNQDGIISILRVPDPAGEWMPDPKEPRLLIRADSAKAEHGLYRLLIESSDVDNDGALSEDPRGGVDLGRNWPHLFQPGVARHGLHAMSEPETRGLAELVLANPRITLAIVYGRNDTLLSPPKGKDRGPTGQEYRDLHPDDLPIYEALSQKYKETTGLKGPAAADPQGALYAWLYSQRGIATLAIQPWQPLERESAAADSQPATQPDGDRGDAPESGMGTVGDSDPTTPAHATPTREQAGPPQRSVRAGRAGRGAMARGGGRPGGAAAATDRSTTADDDVERRVAASDASRKWLKYSDELRSGTGFTPWTALEHPTLGAVEVGGFTPYFMSAPPAEELAELASQQAEVLVELAAKLPRIAFGPAKVQPAGVDLWRIEVTLLNEGDLPTHLAVARQVGVAPILVRPVVEPERILGGPRVERIESLPAGAKAVKLRWLLRGAAGTQVRFDASQPAYGTVSATVELHDPIAGAAGGAARKESSE